MDKQKLTDEERLTLASKLDADLDEFINSLEQRRPTEKVPIDQWEKVSWFNTHFSVDLESGRLNMLFRCTL